MKYNVMTIADIHWGVVTPAEQLKSLEFVFSFLNQTIKTYMEPDLIVLLGDYFDTKLSLNSQEALIAVQWFHQLYDICYENAITLRMVKGTADHDNDQLEVFRPMEEDGKGLFRIIDKTMIEETLPGLSCVYCPDELIQTDEYEKTYLNEILQIKDLGFFHGSFDVVYGDLLERKPEMLKKNNVIFRYDLWNPQIKGPMIAGHWHDGKIYDDLYYCGSPFRWKFNEDEAKGFLFTRYDTETQEYMVRKIGNPLCADYLTYEIYTNLYVDRNDYADIIEDIHKILTKMKQSALNHKLRIVVYVVDEKPENDVFISSLRQELLRFQNCKLTIKNRIKEKKRKKKIEESQDENEKFSFIYENKKPADIIHDFIVTTENSDIDIPMEYICHKVEKYLKEV